MTEKENRPSDQSNKLRKKAEEIVRERTGQSPKNIEARSSENIQQVLHELEVHQIELEMQNEELRQEHEKLVAARAHYFDLYDLAPVGYVTISEQGLITEANLAAATLLGVTRDNLNRQAFSRFIFKDDQDIPYLYRKKLFEAAVPQAYELRMVKKDGTVFWVHIYMAAGRDAEGTPVCRTTINAISDRKRAEDSLKESEERFDQLAEQSGTFTWEVDVQGLYTYVSHVSEAVLGYRQDEMVGRMYFYDLHPESGREAFKEAAFAVFDRKKPFVNLENATQTRDGRHVWFSTNGIPLLNTDGTLRGYRGSDTDITMRKQAEEGLRLSHEELQEAQQELLQNERLAVLGKFSSGIAHELRNPLANMSASAQFCISKYKPDEPLKKHLEIILRNSESANRIIKELLDLAKPSNVSSKSGQIGEVIDNVYDLVRTRCEHQHIKLHKRCSKRLPIIYFDEERMEKALLNIAINAINAMPKGGRLSVTSYFDSINNEVIICFLDTGIGISEENIDKIFNPFFTTREEGTGLGLSLTQQVINYHKGDIQVKSNVGDGTEVIVRLPASRRNTKDRRRER